MVPRGGRDAGHAHRPRPYRQARDPEGIVRPVRASGRRTFDVGLPVSAEQGNTDDPAYAGAVEPRQADGPRSAHDPRHDRRAGQGQIPPPAAGSRMIVLAFVILTAIAAV